MDPDGKSYERIFQIKQLLLADSDFHDNHNKLMSSYPVRESKEAG